MTSGIFQTYFDEEMMKKITHIAHPCGNSLFGDIRLNNKNELRTCQTTSNHIGFIVPWIKC